MVAHSYGAASRATVAGEPSAAEPTSPRQQPIGLDQRHVLGKRGVAFFGIAIAALAVAAVAATSRQTAIAATASHVSLGAASSRTFKLSVACAPDTAISKMTAQKFNTGFPITAVYVVPVTANDDAYFSVDKGYRMRDVGDGVYSATVPSGKLALGWAFALETAYGHYFDTEAQDCASHTGDQYVIGTCLTACPAGWTPPTAVSPLSIPGPISRKEMKSLSDLFLKRLARRSGVGTFVNFLRRETGLDAETAAALGNMMRSLERTEGSPTGINPGWDATSMALSFYQMIMEMNKAKDTETTAAIVKLIATNIHSLGDFEQLATDLNSGVSSIDDLLSAIPQSFGVPSPIQVIASVSTPESSSSTSTGDIASQLEDPGSATTPQISQAGLILDPNVLYPATVTPVTFEYTSPAITAFLADLESVSDAEASMDQRLTLDDKILYFLDLLSLGPAGKESVFEGLVPWLAGTGSSVDAAPGILAKLYELFNYLSAITGSSTDGLAFFNLIFAQLPDLRSFNKLLSGIKLNVVDADSFNLDALTQQVSAASIQEELRISASSAQGPKQTTEVMKSLDLLVDGDKGSCAEAIIGISPYSWYVFTYPTMMEFAGVHICGDTVNTCRSQKLQIFLDDKNMGSHDADGGCVDVAFSQNVTARRLSIIRDFSAGDCTDWIGYLGTPDHLHAMKLCSVEPVATAVGQKLPTLALIPEPIIWLGKDVTYSVTMSSGESTADKLTTLTVISQQDRYSAMTEEEANPWMQMTLSREMDVVNIGLCGTTHEYVEGGSPRKIPECRNEKLKIEAIRNGTTVAEINDAESNDSFFANCNIYSLGSGVNVDAVRISRDYSDGSCEGKTTNRLAFFYIDLLGRNKTTRTVPGFMHTFFEDGGSKSGSYPQLQVNYTFSDMDATPVHKNGTATSSLQGVGDPTIQYAKLSTESPTECTKTIEGLDEKASLTYNFPEKQYIVEGVKICGQEFAADADNCQSKNLVVSIDDKPIGQLDAVGCVTAKFPEPVKGSSLTISRDSSAPRCYYKNPAFLDYLPGNSTPGMHICGLEIYGTATGEDTTASSLPEPFRLLAETPNWTATTSSGTTAAKAIDKQFSNTMPAGGCSTTDDEENPILNVSFGGDIEVKSFMVCGRKDTTDGEFDCRSEKLTVKTMRNGAVVKTFTDIAGVTPGNTRCAMINVDDTLDQFTGTPLDGVVISRDFSAGDCEGKTANQLQICEVRAYARAPLAA